MTLRLSAVLLCLIFTARGEPVPDADLLAAATFRAAALVEVTKAPVFLPVPFAGRCALTVSDLKTIAGNPHIGAWARVFVSPDGRLAAEGREPAPPAGTILLKAKFPALPAPDGQGTVPAAEPELFTGMLKREKGYHPECGDWEFFTVSGDARAVTSRGKLASCVECHQRWPDTDFVSRRCIMPRILTSQPDGSLLVHSRDVTVYGKLLRYEPQPHKNTLGYWTVKDDWAEWNVQAAPGRYRVEILQGCGKDSGGSRVQLAVFRPGVTRGAALRLGDPLEFTVEDTGHFQNFITRDIGEITLPESGDPLLLLLRLTALTKPGGAVMDLRQMVLRPVAESEK